MDKKHSQKQQQQRASARVTLHVLLDPVESLPDGWFDILPLPCARTAKVCDFLHAATATLVDRFPAWAPLLAPHFELAFFSPDDLSGASPASSPPPPPPPPLLPQDTLVSALREARPLRLSLRLTRLHLGLQSLSAAEAAARRGVAAGEASAAAAAARAAAAELARRQAGEARLRQLQRRAAALHGAFAAAARAVVAEEAAAAAALRARFSEKLVGLLKQHAANAARQRALRRQLAEDLEAAAGMPAAAAAATPDRRSRAAAAAGPAAAASTAVAAAAAARPRSLWASTLPAEGDVAMLALVRREIGPPYKRGAPDGLVCSSLPPSTQKPRTRQPEPSKGFLTGVNRAEFGMDATPPLPAPLSSPLLSHSLLLLFICHAAWRCLLWSPPPSLRS